MRMRGRMPISMDRARGIIMFMYEKPAIMANLLPGAKSRSEYYSKSLGVQYREGIRAVKTPIRIDATGDGAGLARSVGFADDAGFAGFADDDTGLARSVGFADDSVGPAGFAGLADGAEPANDSAGSVGAGNAHGARAVGDGVHRGPVMRPEAGSRAARRRGCAMRNAPVSAHRASPPRSRPRFPLRNALQWNQRRTR